MARSTLRVKKTADGTWLFAILLLAFLVRLAYLFELRSHPLFEQPVVDAAEFLRSARFILEGNLLGTLTWQGPLYSYFLAALLKIEDSLFFARLAQALLSTFSAWLLFLIVKRYASRGTALLSSLFFALYGPLVYFDGELLTPSLQTVLNLAAILAFLKAREEEEGSLFLVTGLLLGLSAVTRGTVLLYLPFLILSLFLLREKRESVRTAVTRSLLILGGTAAILSANVLRNYALSGEFILVSPGTGINLYIGNNEDAFSTMKIRPGAEWDILAWEPMRTGHTKPGEQSDYFVRKVAKFAKTEPAELLSLLGKKAVISVSGEEVPRNVDSYEMRKYSKVLSLLLWKDSLKFPFGIFFPLSLLGIWSVRKRWRAHLPLTGYMVIVLLENISFFPTARYRVPMVPVMLSYSATSLRRLTDMVKKGKINSLLASLGVLGLLIYAVNAGFFRPGISTRGEEAFHLGMALETKGNTEAALASFGRALEADPGYAEAHFSRAKIYWGKGEKELAVRELESALALLPEFAEANALLGHIALSSGEKERALSLYREALAVKPNLPQVRYNLAQILRERGDLAEAARELSLVVEENPGYSLAHVALGECLEQTGDVRGALGSYANAITANPKYPRPYLLTGRLLLRLGQPAEATAYLKRARALDPENAEIARLLEEAERGK
jgi:tetratricopeptide (TPR) repeat protein